MENGHPMTPLNEKVVCHKETFVLVLFYTLILYCTENCRFSISESTNQMHGSKTQHLLSLVSSGSCFVSCFVPEIVLIWLINRKAQFSLCQFQNLLTVSEYCTFSQWSFGCVIVFGSQTGLTQYLWIMYPTKSQIIGLFYFNLIR